MNCKWLIFKWAQLGSNQRPPDYESYFFPFRFFPFFTTFFHVIDSQHFYFSPLCCCFLISTIVVYSIVYPAKIFLDEIKTGTPELHNTKNQKLIVL